MKNMNINRIKDSKLVENGLWLSMLQVFNTIVPLLTIPYLSKILGADGYGTFAIALNLVMYFQVIVEYGFGMSGARKVAIAKDDIELNVLYSSILICRLLLTLFSAVALSVFIYLSGYDYNTILCMLILYVMVIGTAFQLTWIFQGKQNMKPVTLINVFVRSASVIAIFVFVKTAGDIYIYCLIHAVTTCISSGVSHYLARKQYLIKFVSVSWKRIFMELKEGWYLFTSTAMSKIFGSIGITILGFVGTTYEAGIYSAISKIPSVFILFFLPISQTFYPHISQIFSVSEDRAIRRVIKVGLLFTGFFSIVSIFLILFRTQIINIAFGNEYAVHSQLLIPLIIWMMASIINNFLGIQILVASGRQKEYSTSFTISIIFLVLYNFILINKWRLWGIAIASAFSEITLTMLLLGVIIKEFKRH